MFSPKSKLSHQDMYKSPLRSANKISSENIVEQNNNLTESPSWRNAYKKRCFDEFKKSRQKLVNRFRNFQINESKPAKFRDYIEEELEKICLLEAKSNLISIDEAIEIYKQIQAELSASLLDPDQELIEEILKGEEAQQNLSEDTSSIMCPVCQKANLIEENNQIRCRNSGVRCNFAMDTSRSGLTLYELGRRLEIAVHNHTCNEIPTFEFRSIDPTNRNDVIFITQLSCQPNTNCLLLMSCENCNFMHSLI